jgi:Zn-finger nucleic acid-binding protein
MELFAERRYYFCRYCGTFEFLEGAPADGVAVVPPPTAVHDCPACKGSLVIATLDGEYRVEHCEGCRGVLIACADFARAVGRRRAQASGPAATPVPLDRRELDRHLACPVCHQPMDVHPYYGPGNIVIDTCGTCNVVWLDYGELKRVADAPGADRGGTWRPSL